MIKRRSTYIPVTNMNSKYTYISVYIRVGGNKHVYIYYLFGNNDIVNKLRVLCYHSKCTEKPCRERKMLEYI